MEIEHLAAAWRRRAARRRANRRERAERARNGALRAAELLQREFGVGEVWLFGSLSGEPRHDDFDLDLAVRGLDPRDYFTALSRVSDVAGVPVDLVTLESCSSAVRRAVATTGARIDRG